MTWKVCLSLENSPNKIRSQWENGIRNRTLVDLYLTRWKHGTCFLPIYVQEKNISQTYIDYNAGKMSIMMWKEQISKITRILSFRLRWENSSIFFWKYWKELEDPKFYHTRKLKGKKSSQNVGWAACGNHRKQTQHT